MTGKANIQSASMINSASASAGRTRAQKTSRSSTIIDSQVIADPEIILTLPPLHPGEILREEFIVPLGLTAGKVAKACGIARSRIERIAAEEIGISGDTAVRLGRILGTGPELWMNLQSRFAIEGAKRDIGDAIDTLKRLNGAA